MRIYWLSSVVLIQLLILVLVRMCILTSWGRNVAVIAIPMRRRIPVISSNSPIHSLSLLTVDWHNKVTFIHMSMFVNMSQHFRFLNLIDNLMRKSHEYLSLSPIDSRWFFSHQSLLFSHKSRRNLSFARRCRTKIKRECPSNFTHF